MSGIQVSASNTIYQLDVSEDNGSTYLSAAGSFSWKRWYGWSTTALSADYNASAVSGPLTAFGSLLNTDTDMSIKMLNPCGASKFFSARAEYDMTDSSTSTHASGKSFIRTLANRAVNKVRITSSSNFKAQGTITLWERKCTT